jgi:hypothetical protein
MNTLTGIFSQSDNLRDIICQQELIDALMSVFLPVASDSFRRENEFLSEDQNLDVQEDFVIIPERTDTAKDATLTRLVSFFGSLL